MFASIVSLTLVAHAWFTHNRDTSIINPIIVNKGKFDYDFNSQANGTTISDGSIMFDPVYPGAVHKNNITFSLTNNDDKNYRTSFYLSTNANDEVPYIDPSGNYYYLGSQIQITKLDIHLDGVALSGATALNKFLVTTSSDQVTKGQNNSVAAAVTPLDDLFLIENVLVNVGQTLSFDIDFTFVDNGTNQNIYKDEWPVVGRCTRNLKVHIYGENE